MALMPLRLINTLKDIRLLKHNRHASNLLKNLIEKEQPDLVYERNEYMQDGGVFVCKKAGVRHLLEVNSPVVEEMRKFEGPSLLGFIARRKERNKMRNTSGILAVSSALKEYISEKYGVKKIDVIPNCINPELEIPTVNEIQKVRQDLFWNDAFIFGFVGSIFPYHGVNKMIEAFALLVKSNPQSRLLIVGDGILKKEYEKLAEEKLPADTYHFAGKIAHKEVFKYIGAFDVAMMPDSNWYGSPVKILEYGWMQKAVIAPDLAPVRDLMIHEEHGVLISKGIDAMKEAMQYCITHSDKTAQMGLKLKQHIEKNFTWELQVSRAIGRQN